MTQRHTHRGFETQVLSDCAPLNGMIDTVLANATAGVVRSMRDVTWGGLSAVLHEYAAKVGRVVTVDTPPLPIQHETAMAADMLGINPIHLANEGCVALFVDPAAEAGILAALHSHQYGAKAVVVGEVTDRLSSEVVLRDNDGRESVLEELLGAELPRLC